ncbi:hypothetical protein MINTMi198_22020 [Mycobacterium intracellulare M.i.198]|uniref:hypothetical protein n=1 Tax=Mycobacterium intracellulare TaxID=1767 RepID=UPI0003737A36|nr:hypothetical protein [Mycobacterium intracellulare]MDM3894525.1 hypothetical protein [Mycobacterium intracellulare]BCP36832.1 hypothetical protein MINTMi198_22020 [Mycobacterium intracellulare M.i.198]
MLTGGDHVHGFAQLDDPVEFDFFALAGGFFDAESGLLVAQRGTVVAVSET